MEDYLNSNSGRDHRATIQSVYDAIDSSIRETRSVELPHSEAAEQTLLVECEDSHDGTYWGKDINGNEWQVCLING